MLTYYSDETVEVTSQALNIHGHEFLLRDVGDVWHREDAREIWVIWRGKELMLIRDSNKTRFGQIYRAIQRALEQLPG